MLNLGCIQVQQRKTQAMSKTPTKKNSYKKFCCIVAGLANTTSTAATTSKYYYIQHFVITWGFRVPLLSQQNHKESSQRDSISRHLLRL